MRNVGLETFPALGEVTTESEPTRLVLAVLDSAGKPVPGVRLRMRLQAPEPGWLPTDLPIVDGSRLVEIELPAAYGTAEWEYFFPIRGVYQLEVTAFDEEGELIHRVFDLPVKESRLRLFYLATFVSFLFVFGIAGGRWLCGARRRSAGRMLVFLSTLGVLLLADAARAQDNKHRESLAIERAVVGKTSRIRWSFPEHKKPVLLTVTITHLEEDRRVLFIPRIATQGSFSFDFQFADGGRHRVMTLGEVEGEAPTRQQRIITVAPVEPAQTATLPTLFIFLGVIAAGLVVGYASCKSQRRRVRRR